MFETFSTESFFNVWYWILTVLVWTRMSHSPMGVPYDLVLRAKRLPEVAARVDDLASMGAARASGISEQIGLPLAAISGFALAALGVLGFVSGIEIAQAAFLLLAPLASVAIATLRLALEIRRTGMRGAVLQRRLRRRRLWNQVTGCVAITAAAVVALMHPPSVFI